MTRYYFRKLIFSIFQIMFFSLLFSYNSLIAQEEKTIINYSYSDCSKDCEIGVINAKNKWGKLSLSIGVHENCCMKFETSASISNDTLNIVYHKYGQPCRCTCNYQLDMKILKTKKKEYKTIKISGKWHDDWDTPEKRAAKFSDQ